MCKMCNRFPRVWEYLEDDEKLYPCTKDEKEEIERLKKLWHDRMFEIHLPLGYGNTIYDPMNDEEIKNVRERLNELYREILKRPYIFKLKKNKEESDDIIGK